MTKVISKDGIRYRVYVAWPFMFQKKYRRPRFMKMGMINIVLDTDYTDWTENLKVCTELISLGFAPYTPTYHESAISYLVTSDAVLVPIDSRNFTDTKTAIDIAEERGIPVFYSVKELVEYFAE